MNQTSFLNKNKCLISYKIFELLFFLTTMLILYQVRNKIKEIFEATLNAGRVQRPPDAERFEIKGKRKGRHQQEGS